MTKEDEGENNDESVDDGEEKKVKAKKTVKSAGGVPEAKLTAMWSTATVRDTSGSSPSSVITSSSYECS